MAQSDLAPAAGHRGGVVVAHPGGQHSRELARVLHEGGLLRRYVTGMDARAWPGSLLPRALAGARIPAGVPRELVRTWPWAEAWMRIAGAFAPAGLRLRMVYAALDRFDRHTAAVALEPRPAAVVGFENGARTLFRCAREAGMRCVLDAASVHHRAQPRDAAIRDEGFWETVASCKDEELALADRVVVLSSYARDTYVAAGVDPARIAVIPPGVRAPAPVARPRPPGRGLRLLFVGQAKRAKGIDLLLAAYDRLRVDDKSLRIVGPAEEPGALPPVLPRGAVASGRLQGPALDAAYAGADLLVLPSRADGFGFVVAEAMAAGLPVLVSSATGAKDLVTEGVNGWIFEAGREDRLLEALRRAAEAGPRLAEMGARAREAAAGCTWERYGERTRAFYAALEAGT